ncbi:MAG TPA: HAD family hydrolase [Acidimicrobiia bacterium]|nr:HAD family hydrolase [Acidimicrobiia bacterium]
MIRLVAFDGDNTLWDFDAAMRSALRSTLEDLWTNHPGPSTAALTVERMIAIRDRVAAELEGRVADLAVVRYAAFERTLEEIGITDAALAARLNAMFFAIKAQRLRAFEDVVPALDAVYGRYRIALLSNGNTDPAQLGLDRYFDSILYSATEGVAKPDPGIFRVLLDRTGVPAEDSAYVGDSLRDDIAGARRAGMHSIWLNRSGAPNTTGIVPDAEVRSLAEVPDVLEVWSGGS